MPDCPSAIKLSSVPGQSSLAGDRLHAEGHPGGESPYILDLTQRGVHEAVKVFVEGCLGNSVFLDDVGRFVDPLVRPGYTNSLAQTLIKLTAPGVPDVYQGTELWAFHFVDPDNRQPVDYDARRQALAEVRRLSPATIWTRADEGLPKLWAISQALHLRARHAVSFGAEGTYTALDASGPSAEHVVAFMRGSNVVTMYPD